MNNPMVQGVSARRVGRQDCQIAKLSVRRLEIVRALYRLIHEKEHLWKDIAKSAMSCDFLVQDDFFIKVGMELDVIERVLGKTEEVKNLRASIDSLSRKEARSVPSRTPA